MVRNSELARCSVAGLVKAVLGKEISSGHNQPAVLAWVPRASLPSFLNRCVPEASHFTSQPSEEGCELSDFKTSAVTSLLKSPTKPTDPNEDSGKYFTAIGSD